MQEKPKIPEVAKEQSKPEVPKITQIVSEKKVEEKKVEERKVITAIR